MENIKEFSVVKPIIDPGLVRCLEDLLKAANQGKLISFAYAGETSKGEIVRGHCTDHPKASRFVLLGAIEYEKHAVNQLIDSMYDELCSEEYTQ